MSPGARSELPSMVAIVTALWPELSRGTADYVVGFGSIAAIRGRRSNVIYASAKRALLSYFESLQHLAVGTPVRVHFYQPGYLATSQTFGKRLLCPSRSPGIWRDSCWHVSTAISGPRSTPGYWRLIGSCFASSLGGCIGGSTSDACRDLRMNVIFAANRQVIELHRPQFDTVGVEPFSLRTTQTPTGSSSSRAPFEQIEGELGVVRYHHALAGPRAPAGTGRGIAAPRDATDARRPDRNFCSQFRQPAKGGLSRQRVPSGPTGAV